MVVIISYYLIAYVVTPISMGTFFASIKTSITSLIVFMLLGKLMLSLPDKHFSLMNITLILRMMRYDLIQYLVGWQNLFIFLHQKGLIYRYYILSQAFGFIIISSVDFYLFCIDKPYSDLCKISRLKNIIRNLV